MVEEQLITNIKTGEELSLSPSIIDSSITINHGAVFADFVVEIKRNESSPKQQTRM